jgi:PEP-CTERM motif
MITSPIGLTFAFAFLLYNTDALGDVITPGKPTSTGTKTISVTVGGVTTDVTVAVNDLDDFESAGQRAGAIAGALTDAHFTASPTASGTVQVDFVDSIKISTNTGEEDTIAVLDLPQQQAVAFVSYFGSLTGTDANGAEAMYAASFAFDGISTQANVSFGDLPAGSGILGLETTLLSLLTSALPPDQRGNLILDPTSSTIFFNFPGVVNGPTVGILSTDVSLGSTVSLSSTSVPEPGTLILLGIGLVGVVLPVSGRRALRK